MNKLAQKIVFKLAYMLELVISFILVTAIGILIFRLLLSLPGFGKAEVNDGALTEFLSTCLGLVIGIELVKMLVKHSVSIAVEVLIFAVARQIVVEHLSATSTLLSIIALAGLFAIRKFLLKEFDLTEKAIYRGNQKARIINSLEHVEIPAERDETLEEVLRRELEHKGEEVGTGAVIVYKGFALKIAKITDGVITRVELMKEIA